MGTLRLGNSVVVPMVSISNSPAQPIINPLTVNPSLSQQVINVPSGVDGYNPVTINAVNNSIDPNISSENIKNGVTVLGVTGNYTGIAPSGTINITSNGNYNVTNYASAVVSVANTGTGVGIPRIIDSNNVLQDPVTLIDLTNATKIGYRALSYAYYTRCIETAIYYPTITEVDDYGLAYFNANAIYNGGHGVTSVSFPNLTFADKHSFECFMSTCSTAYNEYFTGNVDFSSLITAEEYSFYHAFDLITDNYMYKMGLIDFSSLVTAKKNSFQYSFTNNNITSIDFSNLETAESEAFSYAFAGTGSIGSVTLSNQNISFTKLNSVGNLCFYRGFSNTFVNSISFPALTRSSFGNYTNQFNQMLSGCTNVTVHFPSSLQTTIENWSDVQAGFGGTNTTVLYDLPATE